MISSINIARLINSIDQCDPLPLTLFVYPCLTLFLNPVSLPLINHISPLALTLFINPAHMTVRSAYESPHKDGWTNHSLRTGSPSYAVYTAIQIYIAIRL